MASNPTHPPSEAGLQPVAPDADWQRIVLIALSKYGTIVALVVMVVGFSLAEPSIFPTASNVVDILTQVAITGVIASGLTIGLAAGVFDLSIGYVASFAGVLVTGLMANQHLGVASAIVVALAVCGLIGLLNGLIVTKANVNSFIATLGTGTIVVGLNFAYNSGVAVALGVPDSFMSINLTKVLGIPLPVFITAAVALVLWTVLNRTVIGQNVQAVGGNDEAARLAGVRVDRTRMFALIVSGLCAGAGGILLAAKLGSGQTTAADGYLLTAFAAAFLGSVALRDGDFHILGTIIGVITVGVGFNGLAIIGAATFYQYVFNGGLLILAVAVSTVARRLVAR
jgi:ribose transport system permease protein